MAHRRELLAAISGTGLALTSGCLAQAPNPGSDDPGESSVDREYALQALTYEDLLALDSYRAPGEEEEFPQQVAIADIEDTSAEYEAEIVKGAYADPENPLTVEIRLSNTSTEPFCVNSIGQALFEAWQNRGDLRFRLMPRAGMDVGDLARDDTDEGWVELTFHDSYWRATEHAGPRIGDESTIEPGETIWGRLALAVGPGKSPPDTPPDELVFTIPLNSNLMGDDTRAEADEEGACAVKKLYGWGFQLKR